METMDRLTKFKMAENALYIASNDDTLDSWIALYANGVMDMYNPELVAEHNDIAYAVDVFDVLYEMKSSVGIVEDEMLQRAFDLICDKAIHMLRGTVFDDDEYMEWFNKTMANDSHPLWSDILE